MTVYGRGIVKRTKRGILYAFQQGRKFWGKKRRRR